MSGNFIYRHHVEPRVKLHSPREESFPIPLKYIDVSRTIHTNLDAKQEKRIDDYWNIDGSRDLADPWTGFTQFTLLDENPSTPHRSETNGIAERALRRVKEGTSAVLLQSGMDEKWWADSVECCCFLRNIQDLLSDGKTPYERRFGMPFNGPVILFGAMIEYHHISAKDISRVHQFGPKVLPGKFFGYALYAGRNLERRHCGRRH